MSFETHERSFLGGQHGRRSNLERLSSALHLGKELLDQVTGKEHPNSLIPGRPPSNSNSALPSPYENELSNAMNGLNISSPSPYPNGGQAPFIGGFGFASSNAPYNFSAPPPVPSMPVPYGNGNDSGQSLTMQYAQSNTLSPGTPMTPSRPQPLSSSVSTGGGVNKVKPSKGKKPGPGRASSVPPPSTAPPVPPSPSRRKSSDESVQCAGYTKSGPRCARQVKVGPGYDPELHTELFCHQHTREVNKQIGFSACKDGGTKKWVEFKEFIPAYLQEETQAALRSEMSKPRSAADVSGYIYTYQIIDRLDPNNSTEIALKVGRAVKLNKRIDEWTKQCASKVLDLRGFWPENVEDEEGNRGSKLKGMVKAGEPAGWCHKLERLIHLELGDLILNEAYLEEDWPSLSEPPAKKSKKVVKKACPDCGQLHKEIFTFTRPTEGELVGKEFEEIVWPVIKRWGDFVVDYV